ncbi:hypothetical protein ACHAPT_010466 [Fusarium lateritium]
MAEQTGDNPVKYDIKEFTNTDEDFEKVSHMWDIIFPTWPIERQRLEKFLRLLPGHHYIHENGFLFAYLTDGVGQIDVIGVLPEHRGKGLGTALLETAKVGLRKANGGDLKSLKIGSQTPRFWPQMPVDFPQEVKDFFLHRGFHKAEKSALDLFKDIREGPIAPPNILERVSKSWHIGYEVLALYKQHHEAMVAIDPETNEQIGWTLMCSSSCIISDSYAFMPLLPSKEKTGLIAAVGVSEAARGKGVGLALVVKAMENLKERGIEGIYIDSVYIRGFYEKLGFETFWEYEGYVQ